MGEKMPVPGYKSVTVPEEAYKLAEQLAKIGLEESISKAFSNAIKEYAKGREGLIKELQEIRKKWNQPQI